MLSIQAAPHLTPSAGPPPEATWQRNLGPMLMGISRSTFQRVLDQARRQVALALIEGHALQIEGGTFEVSPPRPRGPRRRR